MCSDGPSEVVVVLVEQIWRGLSKEDKCVRVEVDMEGSCKVRQGCPLSRDSLDDKIRCAKDANPVGL